MAGWRKQLRNSPVEDPVTRAAKNATDSVGRYRAKPGGEELHQMAKDLRAFSKSKNASDSSDGYRNKNISDGYREAAKKRYGAGKKAVGRGN